ncbi:MAG: DNA internalization-related competence protein ComEC/Rec2 [Clostridiaceae bacterium]|jgi:competence protein ComEC|nr:DNA internalization-related competence protein ComEC/Rec2 [Clostridiaceae bacterium]
MGILAFFYNSGIICAFLITFACIIAIIKKISGLKFIFLLLFMFYFGYLNSYMQIKPSDNILPLAPEETSVIGQIVSIPNNTNDKIKFFINVSKVGDTSVEGKLLVSSFDDYQNSSLYKIGNTYKFYGKLREPFRATNPSQFDYAKYLRNFHTYTVLYVENDSKLLSRPSDLKWKFMQNLDFVREKILSEHSKYLKSPNNEIIGGVVFGDDAVAPPDDIKSNFVHSGLLHILAASGMNVAFIFGFWFFLLFKLFKAPYKPTVVSGMLLIILYTLMTGLGASVIRAALMLLFVLAGKLIDRDTHSVSLLSLVALLMLIYNPAYINNVSFQLSFLVTLGLLTTGNVLFEKFKTESALMNFVSGSILVPIVAQLWIAPIQMFYFNTFSLYSIFANILSVPFISVISCGGFFSSILAIFAPYTSILCKWLDFLMNFLTTMLVNLSAFFAQLPHSLVSTTHPSLIQLVIYYAIVIFVTMLIKFGWDKKSLIVLAIATFVLGISTINIPSNNLEIIAFDVQNADCFLIKSPENKYFIIDTGKASYKRGFSQAKIILLKYLKDRGIKNFEDVIITHFDNDHSGGTVEVIDNLRIKRLIVNSFDNKSSTSKNIYNEIKRKNVNTKLVKNNDVIYNEPNFKIKTFEANVSGKHSDNINSVVTLLSYKNFDMLFMGDGTIDTYQKIKKDLPSGIEVLKVGHHGANNVVSESMLKTLGVKTSIISTGINRYGHPTAGTLDILRHTDIYRTDKINAIKITSDGKMYNVNGYNRQSKRFELIKQY